MIEMNRTIRVSWDGSVPDPDNPEKEVRSTRKGTIAAFTVSQSFTDWAIIIPDDRDKFVWVEVTDLTILKEECER